MSFEIAESGMKKLIEDNIQKTSNLAAKSDPQKKMLEEAVS